MLCGGAQGLWKNYLCLVPGNTKASRYISIPKETKLITEIDRKRY